MPAAAPLRVVQTVVRDDTALFVPVGMTYEDWEREAKDVQRQHRSMMWWLGDIMIAGNQYFGELYAQAVEPYSEDSITRAIRVCRSFPPQRRRSCGFSFHYSLINLTEREQDELLDQAVANEWTRETFREVLRERRAAKEAAEKAAQQPATVLQLAPPTAANPDDDEAEADSQPAATDALSSIPMALSPNIVEPSEPAPETMAEAIELLEASLDILPYDIRVATEMLLSRYGQLMAVFDAADESLAAGWMVPSLDQAVKAAR